MSTESTSGPIIEPAFEPIIEPPASADEGGPRRPVGSATRRPSPSVPPVRRFVRTRAALRRAFVLREVLGPPTALREPTDDRPS